MSRIWPISFNKRFVDLVESGQKTQTIRKERKDGRVPDVGDFIHCYFGLRTKHARLLRTAIIQHVHEIYIDVTRRVIVLDGAKIEGNALLDLFAVSDGFEDFKDMMAWWDKTHDANFTGFVVRW